RPGPNSGVPGSSSPGTPRRGTGRCPPSRWTCVSSRGPIRASGRRTATSPPHTATMPGSPAHISRFTTSYLRSGEERIMPTPNRGCVYPATSSPATVPADLRAPLEQVDADVQTLVDEFGAVSDKVAELPTAPELDQQIEETILSRSIQEVEGVVAV